MFEIIDVMQVEKKVPRESSELIASSVLSPGLGLTGL